MMRAYGCLVAGVFLLQGAAKPAPIDVAAAISLSETLNDVGSAYLAAGGNPIRLNLAGSNTLARQILNGAPADVFISADEAQMDVVEKAGAAVPGTRFNLVGNQLAVVTLPDRAAFVREHFVRAPPEIRRLAMGEPAAVPAGAYARQYLEARGLWKAYERRVVPTTNVRAALVAVETGGADAAIVYATDASVARQAAVAFVVPFAQGPRIVYPAALLTSARDKDAARQFLAFLRGREASAIFERHGFVRLAAGTGSRE
jgi:molybdate transport system substrate-binding protein